MEPRIILGYGLILGLVVAVSVWLILARWSRLRIENSRRPAWLKRK